MIDFHNKSVAIVGNAQSLLNQNYSNDIDAHDIVCRFNRGIPTHPNQGKKIDILFYTNENLILDLKNNIPSTVTLINTNVLYKELIIELKSKLGLKQKKQKPSIGFLIISYIIRLESKQINLYGFDWKKTKTFYEDQHYKRTNIVWDSHNFIEEEKIIKTIYLKNNNFKIFE